MKIVCLVKQVPEPTAIEFDEETKTLKREGVPLVLNPFDRTAVAEAVRLREQNGGEVVVMTMGPPQAEEALRETLAMGADRAVHLSDRVFAVADTLGTSRTLALALEKEGADLVLCGRKTVDSETWQVPPEVAAFLGLPHLTNVSRIDVLDDRLHVTREGDDGEHTYELEPPVLLSLARAMLEPVVPAPDGDRIAVWGARDLVDDLRPNDKRFGQTGSPTRVLAVRDVSPERAGKQVATAKDAAEEIRRLLDERPAPASSWDKPEHVAEQPAARYDCWTLVELAQGRPTRHSLELLGRGRELAGKLGGKNVALVAGQGVEEATREAVRFGAEVVVDVDDAALGRYEPEAWSAALRQVLERDRPHVLLIPASAFGRDIGPRLAGELELGMTGDCVAIDIAKAGRLLQTKPAYGGNIVSVIMGRTTPQLATVRARMYEPLLPQDGVEAEVRHFRLEGLPERRAHLVDEGRFVTSGLDLNASDTVVLAGAAIGADGVGELATLPFDLAGTHEVCEAGWLPHHLEVGLYGRPVAPRLLIAVGINGKPEDLSGFVKAAVVAGVGEPADWADVSIADHWRTVLPELYDALG